MISRKKIGYVSGAVIVCVLGLWSVKTTNLFSISEKNHAQIPNDPLKKSKVMVADRNTASLKLTDDAGVVAPSPATLSSSAVTSETPAVAAKILTDDQVKNLKQYQEIKTKVFVSDQEKNLKNQFMADIALIKNLKALITESPASEMGSEDSIQKNLALDLLIEASVVGNSPEATAALMEIVQDKKIEDEKMPAADRQAMAEMKADLLYTWTSKMPAQASKVDGAIPGPVTAKIWKNTQAAQAQNRAESATTK